jgi:hypothetical protein
VSKYQDDPNYQLKRIREISNQADVMYDDAVKLGKHAYHAFGGSDDKRRAQMTGLESIANSTYKVSDVYDYVKKQTARHNEWQKTDAQSDSPNESFGLRLLYQLQGELATKAETIADRLKVSNTTDEDKQERRHLHLLLMREFIRQMVVEYEFAPMDKGQGR